MAEGSKPSDAVFIASYPCGSRTQTTMFSMRGVCLLAHQSSGDPFTEEEKFPKSSPATSSTSGTLASPQPEKSLSGRDASNPEVQEKRDAGILVDQRVSKVDQRRPSDTFRSSQLQGFLAEADVNNDVTIMEDVAKLRISKSYQGLPSIADPPRRRSQSWPLSFGQPKTSSKKVDFPPLMKPEPSQDSLLEVAGEGRTRSVLVLNGLEVSKERQKSLKPSGWERSKDDVEAGRIRCLSEEQKSLLPNECSKSCEPVPDSQAGNSASGLVVSAATPPVPVPTACSEAVVPKIATFPRKHVSAFNEFRELHHYRREGDGCFPFCFDEAVQNIDFDYIMEIGKGGFGVVYQDITRKYAIKKGKYRPTEFNILHSLEHRNIIKLLGVKLISPSTSTLCYCIMKKMSCDLEKAYESFYLDGLVQHLFKLEKCEEVLIISNMKHIFKEVAEGLMYLNDKGLFHGDITARNILLCIECGCKDGNNDIFCCKCVEKKYYPVIADFDSVYMFGGGAPHTNMAGTMGFRAPEVCLRKEQLKLCYCCPRSDIFGVGAILSRMLCGWNGLKCVINKANLAMRKPADTSLNSESEGVFIQLMVKKLCQLECSGNLRFLVQVAARCTEVTPGERPLASELAEMLSTDTII